MSVLSVFSTVHPAGVSPIFKKLGSALAAAALVACGGGGGSVAELSKPAADDDSRSKALAVSSAVMPPPVTQSDAVRLADQATFGSTEPLISTIRSQGIEAWLAAQLAATGSVYSSGEGDLIHTQQNANFCSTRPANCWVTWYSSEPLLWDFYRNAVTQPDQLRQRMAWALSQIVVISNLEIDGTYGYRYFHNNLLNNALGNYRSVLQRTALSPLMGQYLNHVNNDKAKPNENFARELLQLFAIGTCKLNLDGSLESGRCLPSYDNATVRNYAYALTGWTFPAGGSAAWGCWPAGANCTYLNGDMVARPAQADAQPRALLSGVNVAAGRTPDQALASVLDSLMNHPNMAPFIGRQLIQHLVKSNPSPAYVTRVATAFRSGRYTGSTRTFGSGVNGDLAATVAAVLLDAEARIAPPTVAEKLREPVLMMTGVLRALNGRTDGEALGFWWGQELRQHLFRAPSVFSHYPPNYPVSGTNLVGSAFGIYNVSSALSRLNFINQLVVWGGIAPAGGVVGGTGTQVDLAPFLADAADPARLVDRFINLATGGRMSATSRQAIVTAVSAWTPTSSAAWQLERVRTAAYLVLVSPAYQVLN